MIDKVQDKPGANDYKSLRNIGFGKLAVECYFTLDQEFASATSGQLAKHLGRPRNGLYVVLKRIGECGFVEAIKTTDQPTYFSQSHSTMPCRHCLNIRNGRFCRFLKSKKLKGKKFEEGAVFFRAKTRLLAAGKPDK